jgi:hypothetical protein
MSDRQRTGDLLTDAAITAKADTSTESVAGWLARLKAERDALRAEVAEAKCLLEDAMEWNWIDLDELIDEGGEDVAAFQWPSLMELRQTIISFINKDTHK